MCGWRENADKCGRIWNCQGLVAWGGSDVKCGVRAELPMRLRVKQLAITVGLVYIIELCVAEGWYIVAAVVWRRQTASDDKRGKERRQDEEWCLEGWISQPGTSLLHTWYYDYQYVFN